MEPWSAKTEYYHSEFYAITCIDTTTNLVEAMTPNQVVPLSANLKTPVKIVIKFQHKSSMTMVMSSCLFLSPPCSGNQRYFQFQEIPTVECHQ